MLMRVRIRSGIPWTLSYRRTRASTLLRQRRQGTDMVPGTALGSSLRAAHAPTDEPSLQSLILFLAIVVFCLFSLFFIPFYFLIAFLWVNWSCFHLLEF